MPTESLLLTALFVLTAVAFIGVLNARGAWRTPVAALLALACLVATLWRITEYRAARMRALSAAEAYAPEEPPGRAAEKATVASSGETQGELLDVLVDARSLHDDMAVEEPERARALPDSEYQAFERRARGHLSSARDLKERVASLRSQRMPSASETGDSVMEPLRLAVRSLDEAAEELHAFFRAVGRDEEERRTRAFRKSLDSVVSPLEDAESRGRPFPGL